jgi:hypothetical protein
MIVQKSDVTTYEAARALAFVIRRVMAALAIVCAASGCNDDHVSSERLKPVARASKHWTAATATATLATATPSATAPTNEEATVFGRPDEPVRRILASAKIENAIKGTGGRSLSFKLFFEGDVQGFFKPEQTFAANWYSELASYYLDRELGLGRVPPAIGRRVEWEKLRPLAAADRRIEEAIVRDGIVRGSVAWWIPTALEPVALPTGWESWLRLEAATYPSPFEPPEVYLEQRRAGAGPPIPKPEEPKHVNRPAELSDLIVFDYLIDNIDRWGSEFTNVRTLGRDGVLMYLDNANGFAPRKRPSQTSEARMRFVQRFRRSTVEAVRHLDLASLRRRLSGDPLAPLLSERQLAELEARRGRLLAHIAQVQDAHGLRAMPW